MPRRASGPCSVPGCPELAPPGQSRCPTHQAEARRDSDQRRGTAAQRGYGSQHRSKFRAQVLARDPMCALCPVPSTEADHYPLSRKELEALGLDPNDPIHGRGLCHPCHARETAAHQPGGWAAKEVAGNGQ